MLGILYPVLLIFEVSLPSSEAQSDHIDSLLCNLPVELTSEQKDRAEQLIRSYAHVFSQSEYNIGCTSIIPHRIDTGENNPHFEQLRRHPTTQLPVIDEHVSHMPEHDVIEPAASPWCSNVVMVRKQDGTMRLCVDYRKLNCLTVEAYKSSSWFSSRVSSYFSRYSKSNSIFFVCTN